MSEIREGIVNTIKKLIGQSSASLAVIYTIGHIMIAMTCNRMITGATLQLAATDAIIEPMINGVWFYILHKLYRHINANKDKAKPVHYKQATI